MSITRFEWATAGRIIFGSGARREAAGLAAQLGRRALVVTGLAAQRAAWLLDDLARQGMATTHLTVSGEPDIPALEAGLSLARAKDCDLVIGLGGGSALDMAKAIAALLANGGAALDYLEVVGRGRPLTRPAWPVIAIPTTAGTGSEVTRNAVLAVPEQRVKASLRSAGMLPAIALIDPELSLTLPPPITASTGLDALTQVIEPFVCRTPNPLADAVCREGMGRAARALRRAYYAGQDLAAREEMALASLCGGLALANARLGAVHGLAGPLGGMFPAPHGALCARLLPLVMAANVQALLGRAPQHPALARYTEAAQVLTGDPTATATDGVEWTAQLVAELDTPPLATYGVRRVDIPEIVSRGQQASSMKGNPLALTDAELSAIVEAAL